MPVIFGKASYLTFDFSSRKQQRDCHLDTYVRKSLFRLRHPTGFDHLTVYEQGIGIYACRKVIGVHH